MLSIFRRERKAKESELDRKISYLVYSVYRKLRKNFSFENELINLTILQIHVLSFLKEEKEVSTNEVAKFLRVEMPTATVAISNLIEKGLVKKRRNAKDRRQWILSLTPKGIALFRRIEKRRRNKMRLFLSSLSYEDKLKLVNILSKLR